MVQMKYAAPFGALRQKQPSSPLRTIYGGQAPSLLGSIFKQLNVVNDAITVRA